MSDREAIKRDDIIQMARQAGGIDLTTTNAGGVTAWLGTATPEFLDRFAALVAAAEREACAKQAENMDAAVLALLSVRRQPIAIAAAIRARGEVPR